MSTVMYAYRIAKDDLWPFVESVRRLYATQSELGMAGSKLAAAFIEADRRAEPDEQQLDRIISSFDQLTESMDSEQTVELVLYDEGDTWLFRVAERGWFFLDHHDEHDWPITPVFYDNRSDDMFAETEANYEVARWMDRQAMARRYLLASVFDRDALHDVFWKPIWRARGEIS
jgi:hypothetical protein